MRHIYHRIIRFFKHKRLEKKLSSSVKAAVAAEAGFLRGINVSVSNIVPGEDTSRPRAKDPQIEAQFTSQVAAVPSTAE